VIDRNRVSYKTSKNDYVSNKTKTSHRFVDRNYYSFSLVFDYTRHDYRSSIIMSPKQNREEDVITKHREQYTNVRKRKQEELNMEECGLVMYAQDKGIQWYIDSGCSKHMIGDQNKFITLKEEKGGNVTFVDNAFATVVGKGIVSLDNGKTKT